MVNGKFVDENPVNGTSGSLIPSSWGNAVTDEILSVIRSTNVVPAESNNAQLTDAIVSIADLRASQAVSKAVAQATENASGVAKVATQAQTNSGVDDTAIITPKKMAGAVQGQALVAFTTGGTAPLFTLAPVPAIVAYAANQRFQVTFSASGGANPTLNVSGVGAKNLKQYSSTGSKIAATIVSGQVSDVVYDGTDLVVIDQLPSSIGATPAQFDNSTNIATAAFVQGVGLQFSNAVAISANTTLTAAAHAGSLVVASSPTAIIVTMPASSTMPSKTAIKFWNFGSGVMTITAAGLDGIYLPAANATFTVQTGAWVTLVSNGANGWYAVDMSGVGVGQTYQNMSSVRVIGTSYPNATGRPIEVSYNGQSGVGGSIYTAVVSGSTIVNSTQAAATTNFNISFTVPVGATYVINQSSGTQTSWWELRS
nr:hypothetical protein [Pseudomonas gingeri]